MAGRHPAQDVLADLAAEVLEEHEARVVEAHVIGRSRCADLLADAERVRQLLMSGDPGPMPAHVWERIAGVLAAESAVEGATAAAAAGPAAAAAGPAAAPAGQSWITQEWPVDTAWVPEPEPDVTVDAPTSQWERFVDNSFDAVVEDRPEDADRMIAAPIRVDGPDGRAGGQTFGRGSERPRRSTSMRSRRDVRTESHTHVLVRYAKPLGIAAGILALTGLAGVAVVKLPLGSEVTDSTAAGSAAAEADKAEGAFAAVFQATGTDYTKADIAQKALQLTRVSGASQTRDAALAEASAPVPVPAASGVAGGGASASAAAGGTSSGAQAPVASGLARTQSGAGDSPLADPERLAACLAELKAPGQNPIAVDLARFDGKEAAIIVLAGRDGGYEVWAVKRTCGDGDPGLMSYTAVPPS